MEAGRPFPFWVRGQAVLTLRVASAEPADVVRLTRGAEVAVAPRPRAWARAPDLAAGSLAADSPGAGSTASPSWLRLQVGDSTQ